LPPNAVALNASTWWISVDTATGQLRWEMGVYSRTGAPV
jgi:hypothetical protein